MTRIRTGMVGLAAAMAVGLFLAACGGNGDGSSAGPYGYGGAAAAPVEPAQTDLGEVLADDDGRTLYAFLKDGENTSNCKGECAEIWPPLIVDGRIDGSQYGTTARPDGSLQLTLEGRPLYRYAGDSKPGETTGQGAMDIWFVLRQDGQLVGAPAGA